jgi:hypothetical protein
MGGVGSCIILIVVPCPCEPVGNVGESGGTYRQDEEIGQLGAIFSKL